MAFSSTKGRLSTRLPRVALILVALLWTCASCEQNLDQEAGPTAQPDPTDVLISLFLGIKEKTPMSLSALQVAISPSSTVTFYAAYPDQYTLSNDPESIRFDDPNRVTEKPFDTAAKEETPQTDGVEDENTVHRTQAPDSPYYGPVAYLILGVASKDFTKSQLYRIPFILNASLYSGEQTDASSSEITPTEEDFNASEAADNPAVSRPPAADDLEEEAQQSVMHAVAAEAPLTEPAPVENKPTTNDTVKLTVLMLEEESGGPMETDVSEAARDTPPPSTFQLECIRTFTRRKPHCHYIPKPSPATATATATDKEDTGFDGPAASVPKDSPSELLQTEKLLTSGLKPKPQKKHEKSSVRWVVGLMIILVTVAFAVTVALWATRAEAFQGTLWDPSTFVRAASLFLSRRIDRPHVAVV